MLGIDVEVPKVDDEDECSDEEEEGETQFHVELDGSVCACSDAPTTNGVSHVRNNGCCDNSPQPGTGAATLSAVYSQKQLMSNEMADKLDVMMTVTFSCLHSLCHPNGEPSRSTGMGGARGGARARASYLLERARLRRW